MTPNKLRALLVDLPNISPDVKEGIEQMAKDAERWQALLNSARIRPLGCAGISEAMPRNYAHLGLELWTVFGRDYSAEMVEQLDRENAMGREWLTKYADIAAAAQGAVLDAAIAGGSDAPTA